MANIWIHPDDPLESVLNQINTHRWYIPSGRRVSDKTDVDNCAILYNFVTLFMKTTTDESFLLLVVDTIIQEIQNKKVWEPKDYLRWLD